MAYLVKVTLGSKVIYHKLNLRSGGGGGGLFKGWGKQVMKSLSQLIQINI